MPSTGPATLRPKKVPKSRLPVPSAGSANGKKSPDDKDLPRPKKIPKSRKNQRGKKPKRVDKDAVLRGPHGCQLKICPRKDIHDCLDEEVDSIPEAGEEDSEDETYFKDEPRTRR
jgi:hypothetical protein